MCLLLVSLINLSNAIGSNVRFEWEAKLEILSCTKSVA